MAEPAAAGTGLRADGLRSRIGGPFAMTAPRGACLAISGRSGSGKSVLLRMVADLDPHEGEVWLDATPRSSMSAHDWRRKVGYLPAQSGWWMDRVGDHFLRPDAARAQCPRLALQESLIDASVAQLSTGERQRLGLLRALEIHPDILLLDEPCSGLDERTTRAVEDLLLEHLRAGLGIVLVSHDTAQIRRLAQAHLHLEDGRLQERAA